MFGKLLQRARIGGPRGAGKDCEGLRGSSDGQTIERAMMPIAVDQFDHGLLLASQAAGNQLSQVVRQPSHLAGGKPDLEENTSRGCQEFQRT